MTRPELDFLGQLEELIHERKIAADQGSYTADLFRQGKRRVAQKVGEEAVEAALAAVAGGRDELLQETADLLYHLLVLLACDDLHLADAVAVLETRHATPADGTAS